jgi:hypothetical protein
MRPLALGRFAACFAVTLAVLLTPFAVAEDDEPSALERTVTKPAATGLLVTAVVPDTQAAKLGIEPGDILVSYAGQAVPDADALSKAKAGAEGADEIKATFVREGWEKTVVLGPGQIGIRLVPVVKDVSRTALPKENVAGFDFSGFDEQGRDDWYFFLREGSRAGVGRILVRRVGEILFVTSEEFLDLGTALEDHEVLSATDCSPRPTAHMTVFCDRMNDWTRYGLPARAPGGCSRWNTTTTGPGIEAAATIRKFHGNAVPVYMVETLVELMPSKKNACFRFLPLYEGSGEVGMESGLVGIGAETVDVAGAEQTAFRFEWRRLDGQVVANFWVDKAGKLLLADYGEVKAVHATKAEAIKDQPEGVRARLAKY